MRLRRHWLAAVVLLAAFLAAPFGALPGGQPGPAEAGSASHLLFDPDDVYRVYLPAMNRAATVDMAISRVEVIQGVTMSDQYTVHIAGRQATVRVFVSLSGGGSLPGVSARLRRYVNGVQQNELTIGPQVIYQAADEGNLSHTINFNLPGSWLTTNSSFVVELDHANSIGEMSENNNRYPATGLQPFNARNMAPLDVVIVPISYKGTLPPTSDLSYLTWMPPKVLPVSQVSYSLRPTPWTFGGSLTTGNGWMQLLEQLHQLHQNESPSGNRLYYGLVDSVAADGCSGGCIAGIGYISQLDPVWGPIVAKTSLGFAGFPGSTQGRSEASNTFTHEMGHNFGRRHAPCGGASGADGGFPYPSAAIGTWGYDNATGQLFSPGSTRDYMSYCGPEWTSDYTYFSIAQNWTWLNAAQSALAAEDGALLVTGYFDEDGRAHVSPLFGVEAAPAPPLASAQRVELLDERGGLLAGVPLQLIETVIETPGQETTLTSFRALVPNLAATAGLRLVRDEQPFYERLANGAAPALAAAPVAQAQAADGATLVRWQALAGPAGLHYRVRFSPDGGENWTVLALDTPALSLAVPADLLAGAADPVVEVQASDGLRTDTLLFELSTTVPFSTR